MSLFRWHQPCNLSSSAWTWHSASRGFAKLAYVAVSSAYNLSLHSFALLWISLTYIRKSKGPRIDKFLGLWASQGKFGPGYGPAYTVEVQPVLVRRSGVESQGGPRGSTTHWPPYRPTPPPAHEKLLNQRAPGGLGPP